MNKPKKNIYIIGGGVLLAIIVVIVILSQIQVSTPGENANVPGTNVSRVPEPQQLTPEQQLPGHLPNQTPSAPVVEGKNQVIIYTDAGFSPKTVTIKKGMTVTFQNLSSAQMWVASNPHPKHTDYPAKGGCISSKFDACAGTNRNASWTFEFDIAGTWKYHDHLNPSQGGTIIVEP